jgi:dihydrofolate reductase
MRKLKLQVQITIDGYVAGPDGALDWMVWDWDEALKKTVEALTEPVDTILLGRKMADGFISHWTNVRDNLDDPEYASGKKFVETPKIVFSKTLQESPWENTEIATGDLTEEVSRLKNQNGGDMIVYGGASFVSALVRERLIDAFYLFVNPVVLGEGKTIFDEVHDQQPMTLVEARAFECGITLLHYEPRKEQ